NLNKKETCKELAKALLRKGNTINHFYLSSASFIPPSFLTSFVNLKNLSIEAYENYDSKEEIEHLQQHLTISEFPYLEYLYVYGFPCFKELAIMIEKSNGNILEVGIYPHYDNAKNIGMLIKAIANNCSRIKNLSTPLKTEDFIYVK